MKSQNFSRSKVGNAGNAGRTGNKRSEPYFTPAPIRLWETPDTGSIEIYDRFSPRVRYAGTLWGFKICDSGSAPPTLIHKLPVTIIGRQGNHLLIKLLD